MIINGRRKSTNIVDLRGMQNDIRGSTRYTARGGSFGGIVRGGSFGGSAVKVRFIAKPKHIEGWAASVDPPMSIKKALSKLRR